MLSDRGVELFERIRIRWNRLKGADHCNWATRFQNSRLGSVRLSWPVVQDVALKYASQACHTHHHVSYHDDNGLRPRSWVNTFYKLLWSWCLFTAMEQKLKTASMCTALLSPRLLTTALPESVPHQKVLKDSLHTPLRQISG